MPPCLEPRDVGGFLADLGIHAAELEYIALESGWQSRAPRKITAAALLSPLCAQTLGGTASFNDIAAAIDDGSGRHPSRQAVAERFEQPCLTMIQAVYGLRRIMAFEAFSIDAYRKNDLKAAPAGWCCVRATSSCATGAASARAKCCAIARPGRTSLTGTRPARSIVTRAVMKFGRIETADRTLTGRSCLDPNISV
jgi:hypothetical protein